MDCIELIHKYYKDAPELEQLLVLHSTQVRDKAMAVIDAHPEWTVDKEFVREAAMLHDIGIIFCDAPKIHCVGSHRYIEHGFLGAELLRKEGLDRHALVAERHTGSGIMMDQIIRDEIPVPWQDYCPVSMEEKIVCYADKFYSKSHPEKELTKEKIATSMWLYGNDAVKRWEELDALMSVQ